LSKKAVLENGFRFPVLIAGRLTESVNRQHIALSELFLIAEREVPMEVKDYCRSVEVELIGWKAKMYDMVRKVDKLRGTDAQNIQTNIEALHKNISDMERIIDQLRTECPLEYGPQKKEIDSASTNLKSKYEDAMAAVLQF
jgi:hypothetical protein